MNMLRLAMKNARKEHLHKNWLLNFLKNYRDMQHVLCK